MGFLLEQVKLSKLIYGKNEVDSFKNNSLFFYDKYKESDEYINSISINQIGLGGFYFLHYKDDSNWMRYSPVFSVSFKKFDNLIILMCVNFNFIPIEVRIAIFDKFINQEDYEKNKLLKVDFEGVYRELLRWGFEYSIVEYNLAQVQRVHKIHLSQVPRFLNSQHPINKYDPKNLYGIWKAKFGEHIERHKEMSNLMITDLYEIESDLIEEYSMLKDHIKRVQNSYQKYG